MNFSNLNTYNSSHELAFEALCTQLFEQWVTNEHTGNVEYLQTINGSGGDGGVESYATLKNGSAIGLQAKWFLYSLEDGPINQIKKSITTAMKVRPEITHYIICLPRNPQSEKIGRGGKPVKNSEESRINRMKTQIAKSYPKLNLEIWYESRLLKELQKPFNEGIARYWFDKEVIGLTYLQHRFDLAQSSWLKERYTPALHTQGTIKDTIDQLLFTPEYRSEELGKLNDYFGADESVLNAIETFTSMAGADHVLAPTLRRISEDIHMYHHVCTALKLHLTNGRHMVEVDPPVFLYLQDAMEEIEAAPLPVTFKNVRSALLSSLDALNLHHDMWDLKDMVADWRPHSCIIVGGPATGKTHGIADAVRGRLAGQMPAMIIQAKTVNTADWASILQHGLGGMKDWTDIEIFSALEAVAVATDIRRAKDLKVGELQPEPTRMLICIDGLDERPDDKNWKNRINELYIYRKRFPRIRFVFTVRPKEIEDDILSQWHFEDAGIKTVYLEPEGDVAVPTLVPLYLKTYRIRYEEMPWISETFDNALSLRLFCEQYKGQDLNNLSSPVVTSLRDLLSAKIKRFEEEFLERQQPPWTMREQVERKSLLSLAQIFTNHSNLTHEELTTNLTASFPKLVDRLWAGHLLDAFCDFGILQRYSVQPDDLLSSVEYLYNVTYESYIDYFTAIRATSHIIRTGEKVLPDMLRYPYANYAIRLTATALLADHCILIGENGYWTSDFQSIRLLELQVEVITATGKKSIEKYLPALKKQFFETTEKRNLIFQRFVLPNISRPDVSLGTDFIHDVLSAFPSTFTRDLVWSGPDHLSPVGESRIAHFLQRNLIAPYHSYTGMPLVYAWSFSSVEGSYREWARHQLAIWARNKMKEFIELLQLVFPCNDLQIKQDLAVVMAAVANWIQEAGCGLAWLVKWIDKNVFARNKVTKLHDVIIRHSCRIVVEKAYRLGECSEKQLKRALPPYPATNYLLPLDVTGEASPQGGKYPIVHDLAWYVIKDAYEKFNFYTDDDEAMKGDLIKRYEQAYGKTFTPYELAIAAAIAFIKQNGWNRTNGPGYTGESHGVKSKVYTFEEKYTWLAVYTLMGYFADLLPSSNQHDEESKLVDDYSKLTNIPNSADYKSVYKGYETLVGSNWFVPEDIAPALQTSHATKWNDLYAWVHRKQTPEFVKWVFPHPVGVNRKGVVIPRWLTLYLNTDLAEPYNIGMSGLQMICCAIDKAKLASFIHAVQGMDRYDKQDITDLDHFMTSPEADLYISIQEIVDRHSLNEEYSKKEVDLPKGSFTILKTVLKGVDESPQHGEMHYHIPSKFVRSCVGITHANRSMFFDDKGQVKALLHTIGQPYHDHQELVTVKADVFEKSLRQKGLVPFWIALSFQSSTLDAKQAEGYTHAQHCQVWIVWQQNGALVSSQIHEGRYRHD